MIQLIDQVQLVINNHVNHTHLIAWLFEPIADLAARPPLRTIDMSFRQEVRLGESLISAASHGDAQTFHKLFRSETVIAQAVLKWGTPNP